MSKKMAKTVPFGSNTPRPAAVDLYKVPHEAVSRSSEQPNALPFPVDPVTGKRWDHSPGAVGGSKDTLHPPTVMTRSNSSVGSSATETRKSVQGKKDQTRCNKQIADLEKEQRKATRERNHPLIAITLSDPESKEALPAQQDESDKGDQSEQITRLNTTIQYLTSERDALLEKLELQEIEFSRVTSQNVELKITIEKEETLRYELEATLKQATDDKKEMETKISEYSLKIENLENVRVELVKEIELIKGSQQKELEVWDIKHKIELEVIHAATREQIQRLENNLQQLGAKHDAESEQIKFEYGRQIDELHQNHTAALVRLESEHSAHISEIQAAYQEQLSRLEVSQNHLEIERSRLHQKCEQIGVTLETKLGEIETLKTQLDVAEEKREKVIQLLQKKP